MPRTPPRVAVLMESSTTWGAMALRGIADYIHQHGHWSIFVEPRGWYERLRVPAQWRGDGVIGRVTSPTMAAEIAALGLPAINMSYLRVRGPRIIQVTTDEEALGRMGAEHLLARGFRRFGYCGPPRYPHYQDRCGPAFAGAIEAAGHTCFSFGQGYTSKTSRSWVEQMQRLTRWLGRLPRPVAVFTWNAERGRQVIDACQSLGLGVPEDVAVLGGDEDEVMCEISDPPLSSVEQGPRRIGYAAAALLDRLMAGQAPPARPVLFAPVGIVTRQSTDVLGVDDRAVAQAVRFIRGHAHKPIQVGEAARAAGVSRRALEQRFFRALGRSPGQEIRRVRLERSRQLLAATDLSVAEVAEASGFNHVEVMTRLFRRELEMTPSAYRRASRTR